MSTQERIKIRFQEGKHFASKDDLAEEEPLEIRVQGVSIAVLMRTPGDDEDLAAGFLCTEGILSSHRMVKRIQHCDVATSPENADNIIQVRLAEDVTLDLEAFRRNAYASSSCGICGKASLEKVRLQVAPCASALRMSPAQLFALPRQLAAQQHAFARSGGLHAAALFDEQGQLSLLREDVGRHNAVDKVVGAELRRFGQVKSPVLLVSGRISFEVVQKAALAGVALVAGISAPTSLAIDLAAELKMTLVGFLRDETMNVYATSKRISDAAPTV